VDAALARLDSSSQDGLDELRGLVKAMRRIEAKLDRMAFASRDGSEERDESMVREVRLRHAASDDPRTEAEVMLIQANQDVKLRQARLQARSIKRADEQEDDGSVDSKDRTSPAIQVAPMHDKLSALHSISDQDPNWSKTANPMGYMNLKLEKLDKKLALIAGAVGARTEPETNEKENRRRLKEKLKEALDIAQKHRHRLIESPAEKWLEYIFGICKPDGRMGKSGSRQGQ
jgi:hypothetical protein